MNTMSEAVKRAMDILGVIILCPFALAIGLPVAILIRLTCGRGVIFRQERAGRNGKPFILYKFRTMKRDVDAFGPSPKGDEDPRLTPLGKKLRAWSLDELPQLWNVLRGEMSLVGPRPLYMEQMQEWNARQRKRLEVKPGLTGLAQVSGRGNLTLEEKLELDVQYVEKRTLRLDLNILLRTAFRVARPVDIYEKSYSQSQETRQRKSPS